MSSSRLFFNLFKFTAIPGVNIGVAYMGYMQYQRNCALVSAMSAERQRFFSEQPVAKLGNSGDALAAFNERAMTRITHSKD